MSNRPSPWHLSHLVVIVLLLSTRRSHIGKSDHYRRRRGTPRCRRKARRQGRESPRPLDVTARWRGANSPPCQPVQQVCRQSSCNLPIRNNGQSLKVYDLPPNVPLIGGVCSGEAGGFVKRFKRSAEVSPTTARLV